VLRRKLRQAYLPVRQAGFTLIEMMIAITISALVSLTAYSIFSTLLNQYFGLQADGSEFTNLAGESQRLANVVRGLTDVISESSNDLTVYAYFAPNDAYVSQIHYYLSANAKTLYADVTPMSANPPIGTPLVAQKATYKVIDNYYQLSGVPLFNYLDASGATLALPIADENSIKGIQINLVVPAPFPTAAGNQRISLQVSLRNRKTNL